MDTMPFTLYCPACGQRIAVSGELCPRCGAQLHAPAERAEQQKLARELLDKASFDLEHDQRLPEALADCELAIEYGLNTAEAHNLRGLVLDALERPDEALQAYREAVRLAPDSLEAQENLAEAEREARLRQQAARRPARRSLRGALSDLLFPLHCPECGLKIAEEDPLCPHCGTKLNEPPPPDELHDLAESLLDQAQALLDHGSHLPQALGYIEQAIVDGLHTAEAHNLRGLILDELGRKDEAVLAYREALRREPDYGPAQENLASAERELQDELEAGLAAHGRHASLGEALEDYFLPLHCPACRQQVSEEDEACPYCGARLDWPAEVVETPALPPPS